MDTHPRAQENLDEPPVHAVLDQVRDIRMPQAVRPTAPAAGPAHRPVGREPGIDLRRAVIRAAALGHPQRRVSGAAEPRPDVLQRSRPPPPPPSPSPRPRCGAAAAAPHRLADSGRAACRTGRTPGRPGSAASPPHPASPPLGAPQPPPVDHLEQRRVPVGSQPPFRLAAHRAVHLVIGVIQERLQLLPGQRPPLRPALMVGHMRRGVPLMEHLHRPRPDPLLALASQPYRGSHT